MEVISVVLGGVGWGMFLRPLSFAAMIMVVAISTDRQRGRVRAAEEANRS